MQKHRWYGSKGRQGNFGHCRGVGRCFVMGGGGALSRNFWSGVIFGPGRTKMSDRVSFSWSHV